MKLEVGYKLWIVVSGMLLFFMMGGELIGKKKDISSSEVLFNRIKKAHQEVFPSDLTVRLESKVIEAQLKVIPKEFVLFGKKPYVEMLYKSNHRVRLKIRNVETLYENVLSEFESILSRSGLYFGVNEMHRYELFKKDYALEWLPKKKAAKVWEKERLEGDWAFFYVDKKYRITHAEYFEEGKKVAALWMHFKKKTVTLKKKKRDLLLLNKITMWFMEDEEKTELLLKFKDHNLKPLKTSLFE